MNPSIQHSGSVYICVYGVLGCTLAFALYYSTNPIPGYIPNETDPLWSIFKAIPLSYMGSFLEQSKKYELTVVVILDYV